MTTEMRAEILQDHEAVYKLHEPAFRQANETRLANALRKSRAFIPALSLVAINNQANQRAYPFYKDPH